MTLSDYLKNAKAEADCWGLPQKQLDKVLRLVEIAECAELMSRELKYLKEKGVYTHTRALEEFQALKAKIEGE